MRDNTSVPCAKLDKFSTFEWFWACGGICEIECESHHRYIPRNLRRIPALILSNGRSNESHTCGAVVTALLLILHLVFAKKRRPTSTLSVSVAILDQISVLKPGAM